MNILKGLIKQFVFLVEQSWNLFQLKSHRVVYNSNLIINGPIHIWGTNIIISSDVRINCGYRANPIGGDAKTILRTDKDGEIVIGKNTGISNSTIVSYRSVKIGDYVLLGGSCKIYDTDFHSLNIQERIRAPLKDIVSEPVVIEDGVFVGAHTIVLKGVTIGKNSIVGAGSVVTKSIPPNEIWAGNPARFIRKINT